MPPEPRPAIDLPTAALLLLQAIGAVALFPLAHTGTVPLWAAAIAACLLMNLSFTTWHECSHGNFSRYQRLNHTVGWLSSLFTLYPGYFARRREHLAHHRWEGDPKLDPVYPRIQMSLFAFPFRLTLQVITREGNAIESSFMPITPAQAWADRALLLTAAGAMAALAAAGYGLLVLWLLVFPRVVIFYLHAVYICWFPHHVEGGGFERYRVADRGLLWRLLTVGQWAHGVHHKNPSIPWHRYSRNLESV
jgi:fatty acid desaturase